MTQRLEGAVGRVRVGEGERRLWAASTLSKPANIINFGRRMVIASIILQAAILLLLMEQLSFTRIIPRPNKPIELDVTNQNYVGDYFFHFFLEEDTLLGTLEAKQAIPWRSSSLKVRATPSWRLAPPS